MLIHTPRLRLLTCELSHLSAIAADPASLGKSLGIAVPEQWPLHRRAYQHAETLARKNPLLVSSGWWLYLFVEPALKALVGSGGFKSAPDTGRNRLRDRAGLPSPGLCNRGLARFDSLRILPFRRQCSTSAFATPKMPAVGTGAGARHEKNRGGGRCRRGQCVGVATHARCVSESGDSVVQTFRSSQVFSGSHNSKSDTVSQLRHDCGQMIETTHSQQ